ncbi:hypothetical protein MKW98_029240 [Papaver atlanticum]|uniref:Wall-associated receptor kinase galacturonan-binding domain-containing protein n=1 Tax=Papaver atlanticum TaxID=357466 RepID=A0AAD4T0E8_9MAGN|nr:hypothetical protein MKW98_029240 [Papaver atlanticum]
MNIILFILYFVILIHIPCTSSSSNITKNNETSLSLSSSSHNFSCGDLQDIQCPFFIHGNSHQCVSRYPIELLCENNRTSATFNSKRFYVMGINYTSRYIRLIDPGLEKDSNCSSMPQNSLHYLRGVDLSFHFGCRPVIYMNCSGNLNDFPLYLNTSPCVNKSSSNKFSTYVMVDPLVSDIKNSCTSFLTSWIFDDAIYEAYIHENYTYEGTTFGSYSDVHDQMMKGFVLDYLEYEIPIQRKESGFVRFLGFIFNILLPYIYNYGITLDSGKVFIRGEFRSTHQK